MKEGETSSTSSQSKTGESTAVSSIMGYKTHCICGLRKTWRFLGYQGLEVRTSRAWNKLQGLIEWGGVHGSRLAGHTGASSRQIRDRNCAK
eukprot:IDg22627t1